LTTFAGGEPVLPTLAVILWAYGTYALFSFIFQRKGGYLRSRSRWRQFSWLTLVGGVSAVLVLIVWCCFSPDKNNQKLKLAGFLGTVYAEGWPDRVDRFNYPPVKRQNQGSGEQPVYALLHPETPASQIEPEKKLPKPRPIRAAHKGHALKAQDKAGKSAKVAKGLRPPAKKDKMAAKGHANKKKRPSAARGG
jgi:hypothetical protein